MSWAKFLVVVILVVLVTPYLAYADRNQLLENPDLQFTSGSRLVVKPNKGHLYKVDDGTVVAKDMSYAAKVKKWRGGRAKLVVIKRRKAGQYDSSNYEIQSGVVISHTMCTTDTFENRFFEKKSKDHQCLLADPNICGTIAGKKDSIKRDMKTCGSLVGTLQRILPLKRPYDKSKGKAYNKKVERDQHYLSRLEERALDIQDLHANKLRKWYDFSRPKIQGRSKYAEGEAAATLALFSTYERLLDMCEGLQGLKNKSRANKDNSTAQ